MPKGYVREMVSELKCLSQYCYGLPGSGRDADSRVRDADSRPRIDDDVWIDYDEDDYDYDKRKKHRWQCHGVDTNGHVLSHALETTRTTRTTPMAMPRSRHQWACIITCPGNHKNGKDDENDEDDEDNEKIFIIKLKIFIIACIVTSRLGPAAGVRPIYNRRRTHRECTGLPTYRSTRNL